MNPKRKSPFAGIKSLLLQYLNFTLSERKGIFLFIILQFLLIVVLIYLKFTQPVSAVNFSKLDATAAQYAAMYDPGVKETNVAIDSLVTDTLKYNKQEITLFKFNPNNLADSLWLRLGLTHKQIRTIKNYETKGGKFYSKADVKKMYCISEQEYSRLAPYINLPETKPAFQKDSSEYNKALTKEKKSVQVIPLEINIANEEELITIPGIGPGRAAAIISYRNKLGGYVELGQVKEAYGMDSVYDGIKKYLLLEIYTTRRININTNIPSELKHPYMTSTLASIIVNYRKVHGDYAEVSELKKLEILNEELYKKLSPYLKVK